MTGDRPTVVVSATPLLRLAWHDAVDGALVLTPDADRTLVLAADVLILDLPAPPQLRAVLRGATSRDGVRWIWVHGDIEPADLAAARRIGVTHAIHRSRGLQPVLEAISDDRERPRATVIGRIRDPSAAGRLSVEETLLLERLGAGSTVAELRAATGWSRHEVERLRVSALAKLGVHSTGEALAVLLLAGRDDHDADGSDRADRSH